MVDDINFSTEVLDFWINKGKSLPHVNTLKVITTIIAPVTKTCDVNGTVASSKWNIQRWHKAAADVHGEQAHTSDELLRRC
jgi:hypothetical protein